MCQKKCAAITIAPHDRNAATFQLPAAPAQSTPNIHIVDTNQADTNGNACDAKRPNPSSLVHIATIHMEWRSPCPTKKPGGLEVHPDRPRGNLHAQPDRTSIFDVA
ncbi:MAG: hypothetical protein ACI8W3_003577 [Myxococcota bacterium]|jgi:hypothetical protein